MMKRIVFVLFIFVVPFSVLACDGYDYDKVSRINKTIMTIANTPYNLLTTITSVASVLAAVFAAWCAFLSYKLSAKLREELKSDEILIIGKLMHPGLKSSVHDKRVITCSLFNKSKRKVFVNMVKAYDRGNSPMNNITWSSQIDDFGNPQKPCELIGIVDTADLFIRDNVGKELDYCKLEIFHSFSSNPIIAVFEEM